MGVESLLLGVVLICIIIYIIVLVVGSVLSLSVIFFKIVNYLLYKKESKQSVNTHSVSNIYNQHLKEDFILSENVNAQQDIPSVVQQNHQNHLIGRKENSENTDVNENNPLTEETKGSPAIINSTIEYKTCIKLNFMSLASGDSGNCFYLGTTTYGILIDAGIGIRTIKKVLCERGIALENIQGILVTHGHDAHIRAVGNLSELFNIPVYATEMVHIGMQKCYCMTKKVSPANRRIIQKGEPVSIRDFSVTPFEIPHDGTDNVGYSIQCGDVNFCFITNIGHITPTVCDYVSRSHYLILEANYDERMLAEGPYPPHLQARISGECGHLSNREAGEFLATHYPPQVRQIWLCNLSKENNKPNLAYHTVAQALESIGKEINQDVRLMALPRTSSTQIFEIDYQEKEETKTLFDDDYIPRTYYTPYILGNEKEYPIVRYPRKGTAIFPYRRQSIHRKGHMDKPFMEYLNNVFGNHLLIIGDCGILPQNNTLPYEPDVAIIDENNPNIRIDIEIDEPYSGKERKPIHYIECGDEFRDSRMNNLGWIVIRFAEIQVVSDMEGCAAFIARVMYSINPKMDFLKKFRSHPNPSPINRWTEIEAKIMESENFRESYLGIESFGEKSDNVQPQPQTQTKEEQEAARHITLNSQKQSFSSVSENKLVNRDQYIQFFPIEHIYGYKEIEEFVSVSKLISYFFRPFDSAYWSQYKATERGISQGEILEEWDEKGTRSKEVGTFMHQQIENYFQGKGFNKEYSYLYKGRYINVEENISLEKECKQFISFLNTHNGITPHKTEWTIYDEDLKIAGTIDMLHKHDDVYDIYDWKRSHRIITHHGKPIIDNDYFTKGINGLDSVSDTVYWHYCIQQNLYRYILEKNYDIKIGKMYLIVLHADYDNYCKLEVPEMNDVINIIVQTCKNKSLSTILCSHKN